MSGATIQAANKICNRPAKRVVIISRERSHVERDRQALKRFPLEVDKIASSGAEAYKHIAKNPCDLVLCDTDVDDIDPYAVLRSLKANKSLKHIPVVMVTRENDRGAVLDAVAAGCSGYILRPYSDETFERHVNTALQLIRYNEIEARQLKDARLMMETGDYDEAIEEFEEVLSQQEEAQKFYDIGCTYLAKDKFGKAIVAFQKALKINDMFAEAYEGLSEAYKRKGDLEQCQFFLKKAADLYAAHDHMEKVKEVFIDILKMDNRAANPFNSLGVKLRKVGDYQAAIRAYKQALELTPNDENVHFNMAKAYYFMSDTENALDKLAVALSINQDFPEALTMYKSLKGAPWPGLRQQGESDMEKRHRIRNHGSAVKDV